MKQQTVWDLLWRWAGRVSLRQKIMGIIVAPLFILGSTIAWWVSSQLGGWLSYLLSEERVAQAMSVGMRSVFIITVFATVVGLGIGSFLTWILTHPIINMTYVARRVKNGDLSVRAPVWANDEIGELARTFNDMIGSLDQTYRALERSNEQLTHRNRDLAVLYQLADMANKSPNIQEVSHHGLQQTLLNTGSSAGLLLLINDNETLLAAVSNLPEHFQGISKKYLADLNYKQMIDNGYTLLIEDVTNPIMLPGELLVESQKLSYRAALLAPMMIRTGTYAALFLLFQDTTVIAPQHYQLIRGICNQLSVTIQNSQLWEELRHKEQIRTLLLHKLVSAQEAERQRISRELHDETGQALTSLLVQLKILEKCSTLTDVQEQVQGIRKLTAQTLQEVRRLAAHLRPSALDDLGLISALEGYIYDYAGKSGITVDFQHHNLEEVRLPHDMEIVLYRVVQESLTNVLRHAQASQVQVMIRREYKSIQLSVVDNGRGFDVAHVLADKERGLGLLGMQERIELLGGTLVLDSTPGHGSRVEIDLTMPDGVLQKDAR